MVDPIGAKPASSIDRRIAPVGQSSAARAPSAVSDDTHHAAALSDAAQEAAKGPPIDQERVARLRAAIADRSYRISPQSIADRLIAVKQEWTDR